MRTPVGPRMLAAALAVVLALLAGMPPSVLAGAPSVQQCQGTVVLNGTRGVLQNPTPYLSGKYTSNANCSWVFGLPLPPGSLGVLHVVFDYLRFARGDYVQLESPDEWLRLDSEWQRPDL